MSRKIVERFAPVTRSVSDLLRNLTPAANDLWVYLRQAHRPGIPFIIRLREIAPDLGYSVRWLSQALGELFSVDLVNKLDQWWGQSYRLLLKPIGEQGRDADDATSMNKNGDCCHQTSKLARSNPHSSVPLPRDLEKSRHGVSFDRQVDWYEQECSEPICDRPTVVTSSATEVAVTEADVLYQKVSKTAPGFNPKVFSDALSRFGATRIRNALSAVEEQVARGYVRSVTGALYAAIYRGFTSNEAKRKHQHPTNEPLDISRSPQQKEIWHLPGTTEVFVVPVDERTRWQQVAELKEQEFRKGLVHSTPVKKSEDLSSLLVQISLLIRETGLNREQVSNLLEQRYQVRSQQQLLSDQLGDWLNYLKQQPKQYQQTAT